MLSQRGGGLGDQISDRLLERGHARGSRIPLAALEEPEPAVLARGYFSA